MMIHMDLNGNAYGYIIIWLFAIIHMVLITDQRLLDFLVSNRVMDDSKRNCRMVMQPIRVVDGLRSAGEWLDIGNGTLMNGDDDWFDIINGS